MRICRTRIRSKTILGKSALYVRKSRKNASEFCQNLHGYTGMGRIQKYINPKNKFERRDALWNSLTAWCQKT